MIDISGFSKTYGDSVAVDRLSFRVEPGQILGLIGRNGAGKTTTLRAITGILPATVGDICVGGASIANEPMQVKQRTAYVPDDPQLFQDLTVQQHLLFTASAYRIEKPESAITNLLERFELQTKRHARASSLSRGMRQKLAICCAWLQQPDALLLDEPMTGLDPPGIRNLKKSIVEIAGSGSAVIISSHLLAMVQDICSHILIIDHGQTKFFGTIDSVKQQYAQTNGKNGHGGEDQLSDDESSLESIFFAALEDRAQVRAVLIEPDSEHASRISVSVES